MEILTLVLIVVFIDQSRQLWIAVTRYWHSQRIAYREKTACSELYTVLDLLRDCTPALLCSD